jgi:hypothetical protein
MDTNKIILIFGLLFLLFLIMHNVRIVTTTSTPNTTATATKTTVVYKNPVNVVTPTPHYNPYKSQYYN